MFYGLLKTIMGMEFRMSIFFVKAVETFVKRGFSGDTSQLVGNESLFWSFPLSATFLVYPSHESFSG